MSVSGRISSASRAPPWQIGHTTVESRPLRKSVAVAAQSQAWMLAWGAACRIDFETFLDEGGIRGRAHDRLARGRAPNARFEMTSELQEIGSGKNLAAR